MRKVALQTGPVAPVGSGNGKTRLPSTYRPIGGPGIGTCHPACPFLGAGCYGEVGRHTSYCSRVAGQTGPWAQISAMQVALVASRRQGTCARLHVTGDLIRNGRLDRPYVEEFFTTARILGGSPSDPVAFSYTHVPGIESILADLATVGIPIRQSDAWAPGGAVVWPHDRLAEKRLQLPWLRLVACPAQGGTGVTCRTCGLCWRKPGLTIVFDPHGASRTSIVRRLGGES